MSAKRKEAEETGMGEEHEAVAAHGVYHHTDTITDATQTQSLISRVKREKE